MIREYLKEHILITDGAMGTYYDRKKTENGRIAEEANLLEPELITRIHEEYLEQGARLIRTNTFAANHAMACLLYTSYGGGCERYYLCAYPRGDRSRTYRGTVN